MRTHRRLGDEYRFPGFRPVPTVVGIFGDPNARVVHLQRREKTACGACGRVHRAWYDRKLRRVRDLPGGDTRIYRELEIRRVAGKRCGKVKQEKPAWLADTPFDTQRFAFVVGRRCRPMTIKDVAEEPRLDGKTIKDLDAQYMRAQVRRAGNPAPKVIGIDEISIRKGHTDRIVVSDLERRRPIWFGGKDRSEESMDECSQWLGSSKSQKIRLAVMDRWKAFRHSTLKPEHAPQAAIRFDKFHVRRHLGEALDKVRKSEYSRLTGQARRFIKGQKYTRLSHRENLTTDGRRSLRWLRKANKRLNTAYPPQGGVRQALGLRAGRLGAALFRELARVAEVAAPQALREVRRDDRPALGRHRGLLQAGEQGRLRIRRGAQQ